jgi:N-acetylated-alpha-linked acidic dipeptidase
MHKILLLVLAAAHGISACERHLLLREPEKHHGHEHRTPYKRQAAPFPPKWTDNEKLLHESFSTATIDAWSSYYTHGNHIAGLNKSMAEATRDQWIKNGVPAEIVEYEVLLSYPKQQRLRQMYYDWITVLEVDTYEDKLPQDETTMDPNSVPNFHGYSASGDVMTRYVYVG